MTEIDPMAAVACPPVLPEDIVVEILGRLPDLVSLYRCSVVCKRWRRLVVDPAFLRRRWPEGCSSLGESSLLGFFVQRHWFHSRSGTKVSRLFPSSSPLFVPTPDSVLGPERRFLTSFIRDDARILDDAKALVARGGLLLVRLAPRSSDNNNFLRLCLCNLLIGKLELLPPLDASLLNRNGIVGYGLLTTADHEAGPQILADGYSTLVQVLLIGHAHMDGHLLLLKFSSSKAGSYWCDYDCSQLTGVQMRARYGSSNAAVARGSAQWIFCGNGPHLYTLDVQVNTGHISVTMLPINALPKDLLCTIDDRLVLLYFSDNYLVLWSHTDEDGDGTLDWVPTPPVKVDMETGIHGELSPVCAGEKSGTMLALYQSDPECAYMVDLQSGSTTKVSGWMRSFNYMTVVPYEINWPVFFMSRLGVQL